MSGEEVSDKFVDLSSPTKRQKTLTHFYNLRKRAGSDPNSLKRAVLKPIEQLPALKSRSSPLVPEVKTDSIALMLQRGFGSFYQLPTELLFYLFENTNLSILSRLVCTSDTFRQFGCRYLESASSTHRFKRDIEKSSSNEADPYGSYLHWGTYLKRLTCILTTEMRLKVLAQFHQKVADGDFDKCDVKGMGKLLMRFVQFWDFNECRKAFNFIMSFDNRKMLRRLSFVIDSEIGVDANCELQVRRVINGLFLDHQFDDRRDFPFWLTLVLHGGKKERSRRGICKLMNVLYAPITLDSSNREVINYNWLCNIPVTSWIQAKTMLSGFARAFEALHVDYNSGMPTTEHMWMPHEIFALVEGASTFPEPWALDNFCALLLLCPNVAIATLYTRIINDYGDEAANMICTMKDLVFRWRAEMITSPLAMPFTDIISNIFQRLPVQPINLRRKFYAQIKQTQLHQYQELINTPGPELRQIELATNWFNQVTCRRLIYML